LPNLQIQALLRLARATVPPTLLAAADKVVE